MAEGKSDRKGYESDKQPAIAPVLASSFDEGCHCQWHPLKEGEAIPSDALRAGVTKPDGLCYVARLRDEVGKININNATMNNFWSHRCYTPAKQAEILRVSPNVKAVWASIARGDAIPDGAVLAADRADETPTREASGMLMKMMNKTGMAPKAGSGYVGRFNGEPGLINVTEGHMCSFWGHYMHEQGACEILTFEPVVLKSVESMVSEAPKPPMKMRMLQFNIWQEGWEIEGGHEKIAAVIAASGADIVALSEVRNWSMKNVPVPYDDFHVRLKASLRHLGLHFHGNWVEGCDVGLVSRWPIEFAEPVTDAKRSAIAAYHIRTPAGLVCVCSAHLDWKNYALNLVRGYDADTFWKLPAHVTDTTKLLEMDAHSGRGPSVKDFLKYAADLPIPVILAGDFNECSHLDWTNATKDMYGHSGVEIEWTHSKALVDAGFSDSWREIFPNPVTHMGATWPSQAFKIPCTSWAKESDERDRIDFIYHNRCRMKPVAAHIVGPKGYFVKGEPVDAEGESPFLEETLDMPWPSDHKGVIVEFEMGFSS